MSRLIPNFLVGLREMRHRFFWSLGMVNHNLTSLHKMLRESSGTWMRRGEKTTHSNFFELIMASHGGFPPHPILPPHPGLSWKCRLSRQIECLELPSRSTQKSLIFIAETPQGKRNQSSVCSEKPEGFVNLLSVTQENLMKSQIIDDSPLKSVEHLFPREVHNSLPASSHNQFRLHKDANAMLVS